MAKLIDFEREYMLFAAAKLRGKSEIKDEELTGLLNDTMQEWLSTKSAVLGNMTPDEYFTEKSAEELVELVRDYCAANMNVPEPLYGRIGNVVECIPFLKNLAIDAEAPVSARSTALTLLSEMKANGLIDICAALLACEGDVSETAADKLKNEGYAAVSALEARYDNAGSAEKAVILDILACCPGVEKTTDKLIDRLYNDSERRAFYANIAGKFGDDRLLEPLMRLSQLTDMEYFDYIEIVNAIDALGGDPGIIREFYGDPDYEALRVSDAGEEDEN